MAVSVARYNPVFKEYLTKKIAEGKKYRQAVIAVANKLIRVIFYLLKNKSNFAYNF
jgi:transposase